MEEDSQRTLAVWTVFVLSFLLLAAFLYGENRLTYVVVVSYWLPVATLTGIGVVPPPWEPLAN